MIELYEVVYDVHDNKSLRSLRAATMEYMATECAVYTDNLALDVNYVGCGKEVHPDAGGPVFWNSIAAMVYADYLQSHYIVALVVKHLKD